MKVIITGGHHSSGLLVAKAFQKKGEEVFWFGHKYSMLGDKKPSIEYLEVTKEKIPFIEIKAGKLQRKYRFIQNLLRIPLGYWQSFINLFRIRPDVIISFGGYIALPVAICGRVLGIPVFTHEQTAVSGFANKIIARFAKKIFISFKASEKYFPSKRVVFSGLPIRDSIFSGKSPIFKKNNKRTIYITGGKQGSHIINEAVFAILPKLLTKFNVIHQCGSTSIYSDFDRGCELKRSLGENGQNYLIKEYFFDDEISSVFSSADFVVGRSGAHTVYELMVLGKPAVLIPIPWSNNNEQMENAKMLVALGLAEILSQEELEEGLFFEKILQFDKNLSKYKLKDENLAPRQDAIEIIMEEIYKTLDVT